MKQYVVTEEEFMSLLESLELASLRNDNVIRDDPSKPPTADDMHRAFHFVVTRWVQNMGFKGHRG